MPKDKKKSPKPKKNPNNGRATTGIRPKKGTIKKRRRA